MKDQGGAVPIAIHGPAYTTNPAVRLPAPGEEPSLSRAPLTFWPVDTGTRELFQAARWSQAPEVPKGPRSYAHSAFPPISSFMPEGSSLRLQQGRRAAHKGKPIPSVQAWKQTSGAARLVAPRTIVENVGMPGSTQTLVVMPAYNAANTVERTYRDLPMDFVDEVILVDDNSKDDTVAIAESLGITVIRHTENKGYGANQKSCYAAALERSADYVVMIHPDYQYDARTIPAAVNILQLGICDVILGNRIRTRTEALAGGMPPLKYFANRGLTIIENVLSAQNLGEWHSGFRAYNRKVLETLPYHRNSDDFVFDSQFLVQCVHFGFKLGDIPVPVRYFDEASSINLQRSATYALLSLWTFAQWYGHRTGIHHDLFRPIEAGA